MYIIIGQFGNVVHQSLALCIVYFVIDVFLNKTFLFVYFVAFYYEESFRVSS